MSAILIKLLWIFLWKYSTKNCGKIFFLNKTKTEAFLDKYGHTYWETLQKKKKKKKKKIETNLVWFRTVGGSEKYWGHCKTGHSCIWQIAVSHLHGKCSIVFHEKCLLTIFREVWTLRK